MNQRPVRVLLDTNVWRHLADADQGAALLSLCNRRSVQLQVAPCVLYEAIRTGDPAVQKRQVDLMTRPAWTRLMPEAFEECEEFLGEACRLRPEWLCSRPGTPVRDKNRRDWARRSDGFWDRVRTSPGSMAAVLNQIAGDGLDRARMQMRRARSRVAEAGWTAENLSLATMTSQLLEPTPGWDGAPFEFRRGDALPATPMFLESPYADWVGEIVTLNSRLLRSESWGAFLGVGRALNKDAPVVDAGSNEPPSIGPKNIRRNTV